MFQSSPLYNSLVLRIERVNFVVRRNLCFVLLHLDLRPFREFLHDDTSDSLAVFFQVYYVPIVPLYFYWLALDLTISSVLSPSTTRSSTIFNRITSTLAAIWTRIKSPLNHFPTLSIFLAPLDSFNAYAQISSRALRQSLKETARLNAEKRGITDLRFQKWENGNGGPQVCPISVHPYASLQK